MSQRTLSEREKEYIRAHIKTDFKRQIAHDLGELYPEDNGGHRHPRTIRLFVREEHLVEE